MKIAEFSALCGCNPKTLRYYDAEGLLKPVEVDRDSGYRHYTADQAIAYIKIKNLQRAGFTIGEIRVLLGKSDAEIYEAFGSKIAEAEKKLLEIREIQKAYQSEMTEMKSKIRALKESIMDSKALYDPTEEFSLDHEQYLKVIGQFDSILDDIIRNEKLSSIDFIDDEGDDDAYLEDCLNNPYYETVYEKHGWHFFKDLYDELPAIHENEGYMFLFRIVPGKGNMVWFASTVISLMLDRVGNHKRIGCTATDSSDGRNHFWLVRFTEKAPVQEGNDESVRA